MERNVHIVGWSQNVSRVVVRENHKQASKQQHNIKILIFLCAGFSLQYFSGFIIIKGTQLGAHTKKILSHFFYIIGILVKENEKFKRTGNWMEEGGKKQKQMDDDEIK